MLFLPRLALGGDEEIRTLDPLLAGQVLSQLSYTPRCLPGFGTLKIEQRNPFSLRLNSSVFLSFVPLVRWALLFLFRLTVCLLVSRYCLHRKEVIQPHLPIRLPCYDFTPIIEPTFGRALLFRLGYGLRVFPTLMV